MAKELSTYSNLLQFEAKIGETSEEKLFTIMNVENESVEIINILLKTEYLFEFTSDSLPITLAPHELTLKYTNTSIINERADAVILNDKMYTCDDNNDVKIYQINENGTISFIRQLSMSHPVVGIGGYGNVLIACMGAEGIVSILINEDGTLTEVEAYDTGQDAYNVVMTENFAYVANGTNGLSIYEYNALNANIVFLTNHSVVDALAVNVDVDNNFIYVCNTSELSVYSFDGYTLLKKDSYSAGPSPSIMNVSTTATTEHIFVSDSQGYVYSLSVSSSGTLTYNNTISIANPNRIKYSGTYLYITTHTNYKLHAIALKDDGTIHKLASYNSSTGTIEVPILLTYNNYIFMGYLTGAGGTYILTYEKNADCEIQIPCTFSPETDETVVNTIHIYSDASDSPDEVSLEGTGLGNAENGMSSINYMEVAKSRIATQYKADEVEIIEN